MYAERRFYTKQWDHQKAEKRYAVRMTCGGKPVSGVQADRISEVAEEVMYWRKANHIHAWFVDNVQGGNDDCGSYYVSEDQLRQLLGLCRKVLDASTLVDGSVYAGTQYSKEHPNGVVQRTPGKVIADASVAIDLLPVRSGFFFGSTEYDEYYLRDVQETHDWAERMLTDIKAGCPGKVYYSSSW
jgi:hypothetical protein